ncbi:MAG TPA: hypothetical protein VN736_09940 [Candidatus Limnocylindrales bacterium]|nr:hypothetical protein [Candidatus Limnocylindrales bacterium]
MKYLVQTTAIAACVAFTLGAQTRDRGRSFNLNTQGHGETCADLQVTSRDGEIARSSDKVTLGSNEASGIELNAADHASIQVRGWNQSSYEVETCKIAVAADRGTADQVLSSIAVTHSGGRFSYTGPEKSDSNWQVYFIIHTPANARLDLETRNGPVSVSGVNGNIKLRAGNGPLAIKNTTGNVDAQTQNGPISFEGESGDVHLHANNGPISVKVAKDAWNGTALEAATENGPVSLNVPSTFRTGVRIESSRHSPVSCRMCSTENDGDGNRVMRMNGASDTIRVSTHNGPVSVGSGKAL